MVKVHRPWIVITTALLGAAVVIAFLVFPFRSSPRLTLRNDNTGKVFASYDVSEGDEFAITFRHSVNKSNVTEIYRIQDGKIILTGCVYYDFGAGVAEVLEPTWKLTMGDNGEMIISEINMEMPDLVYIVGTIYDHIMTLNGEDIILNELCGKNAQVRFSVE